MAGKKKIELDDNLADSLISTVNSKVGGNSSLKIASYLDDPEMTADVTDFVSTGSSMLDLAISNRPNGGIPVGRITEITGLEASGKSLLAAHLIASTQKKGGIGVFIDTESAVSREFFEAIGVDVSKMIYASIETIEDVFLAVESIIERVRRQQSDKVVTIVVDSIMGASTKQEMEAEYDKDGYATAKAIIISKAMRKLTNLVARQKVALVLTNQLRVRMGVSFGDPWTTSGGKAIPFHSSVRLRLKAIGQITTAKDGVKQIVGVTTRAQVVKNRIGPPQRVVDYDIYYASGIDDYGSWLSVLKQYKYVTQKGAWYEYTPIDPVTGEVQGEPAKFQSKDFAAILENDPNLKQVIYDNICSAYIMKYNTKDFGIDDVEISEDFIGEDD